MPCLYSFGENKVFYMCIKFFGINSFHFEKTEKIFQLSISKLSMPFQRVKIVKLGFVCSLSMPMSVCILCVHIFLCGSRMRLKNVLNYSHTKRKINGAWLRFALRRLFSHYNTICFIFFYCCCVFYSWRFLFC